jgi:dTDP-4-amino-4,6-dideoxygalactose transaminase
MQFNLKVLCCEKHFPNSLYAYENGLVLPLYGKLTQKNICYISENILNIISGLFNIKT